MHFYYSKWHWFLLMLIRQRRSREKKSPQHIPTRQKNGIIIIYCQTLYRIYIGCDRNILSVWVSVVCTGHGERQWYMGTWMRSKCGHTGKQASGRARARMRTIMIDDQKLCVCIQWNMLKYSNQTNALNVVRLEKEQQKSHSVLRPRNHSHTTNHFFFFFSLLAHHLMWRINGLNLDWWLLITPCKSM